jgi:signal peptidase
MTSAIATTGPRASGPGSATADRDVDQQVDGVVASAAARGSGPTARHPVKDAVLALAGLAGALSLVWLLVAAATGLSVVIVTTGSMSPTMPTGSAALLRPVAASEVGVGDVVTVRRPGARLPVTHRVVAVAPDPDRAEGRILVLRGDANTSDDPYPYQVREVGLVVASAPMLGFVLSFSRQPLVAGTMTIGIAVLVAWAFWPSRRAAHRGGARS